MSTSGPDGVTVARHFERRAAESIALVEARGARMNGALVSLVEVLRSHGARRVWLFGSLAWGGMHESSDIDLAVEGLEGDMLLRAQGELLLLAPCLVDLVRVEDAPAAFAQRIVAEGRLLHG